MLSNASPVNLDFTLQVIEDNSNAFTGEQAPVRTRSRSNKGCPLIVLL